MNDAGKKNARSRAVGRAVLRASGVAFAALLWELAPRLGWVDGSFFPPLSEIFALLGRMALDGSLASHVLVSAFRGVAGFLVAIAVGVPLGLLLGFFAPTAYRVLEPLLRIGSQVNPFALMSIFLLFFGSGEAVKVVAVAWVALWPILFYTVTGVRTVDPALMKVARAHAASRALVAWRVVLPAAVPTLFIGLRLGTGLVFFMLVAAEMLGASRGLGWFVHNSAMNYRIKGIYAGALAVVLLGSALAVLVRRVESYLFITESGGARVAPAGALRGAARRPLSWRQGLVFASALVLLFGLGLREARRVQVEDEAAIRGDGDQKQSLHLRRGE